MTSLAFGLVITSAFTHAIWNFLAKRAGGDITFVWLFNTLGSLIYLPVAIYIIATQHPVIGLPQITALTISTLLHLVYYFLLTSGYQVGDLSLVYPLARGTGPLLSTLGAIVLFSERPSPLVILATVLIAVGIFIIAGNPFRVDHSKVRPAITYGLLTGLAVAAYTLWDKQSVSGLGIPPVLLTWFGTTALAAMLTPYALRYRSLVAKGWNEHRWEAIGIGILDGLGYMLFLLALSMDSTNSPVSHLAPLRQTSILIGAFLGARVLAEGEGRRRLIAATVMLLGVVVLAIG